MDINETFAKMQQEAAYRNAGTAQKNYAGADCCNQAMGGSPKPQTLHEEAANRASYFHEQTQSAIAAAKFFKENPQFDEFVRLVQTGVIKI